MAATGEVAEEATTAGGGGGGGTVSDLSPSSSCTHTPYYCEENVYFLCKKLCVSGVAEQNGSDLFVVFISNEEKKIPMWCQKASKRTDGLVIWDYHVICIQLKKNDEDNTHQVVWDLDSSLPCPTPLKLYAAEAFQPSFPLNPRYSRHFRVVHAPILLQYFASDRSHMRDSLGKWLATPPEYKPIVAEDGTENNLREYIRMCETDILSALEATVDAVYFNKYGVVISESMLEKFFSQVHQSKKAPSCERLYRCNRSRHVRLAMGWIVLSELF